MESENIKKIRIGWFTFTCCEDSTILFTELLNDHFFEWKKYFEFVHFKVLQTNNSWAPMDVAFVEGAITSDSQREKLLKIRSLSKKLIAIGACAVTGQPSGQRNTFDEKTKKEIEPVMLRLKYSPTVQRLNEVITVDDFVPGCPMDEKKFLTLVNELIDKQKTESN